MAEAIVIGAVGGAAIATVLTRSKPAQGSPIAASACPDPFRCALDWNEGGPAVIEHGPGGVLAMAEGIDAAPRGWVAQGPTLWRWDMSRPRRCNGEHPVVLTVGRVGDAEVVVNLDAIGALEVCGEETAVDAALRQFWAELRWPGEAGEGTVGVIGAPDDLAGVGLRREEEVDVRVRWPIAGLPAAVVRNGAGGGRWRLNVESATAVLQPIGLELGAVWGPPAQPLAAWAADPSSRLEIRVLGPVEITGAARALRKRSRELAAYLATHPAGVTEEQVRTALWPERVVSRSVFNNLVSETRAALGRGRDGAWFLPRLTDARYRLAEGTWCDLTALESALNDVRGESSQQSAAALEWALAEVRGVPFDGEAGWAWAFDEGVAHRAEAVVAATAHRLIELTDRPAVASWAAAKALSAVADPAFAFAAE